MNPARYRGTRKALRDLFQVVVGVVAGGGAYAVLQLIVGSVSPVYGVVLAFVFKVMVAFAQNYLETAGSIGVMLPTPGLVTTTAGGLTDTAVGTVDAVVQGVNTVAGDVVDRAGDIVGEVTGTVTGTMGAAGGHGTGSDDPE